jgi:hypothetical protein
MVLAMTVAVTGVRRYAFPLGGRAINVYARRTTVHCGLMTARDPG